MTLQTGDWACSHRSHGQGAYLLLHGWVHNRPEDEVALGIHQLIHGLCSGVHLHHVPAQPLAVLQAAPGKQLGLTAP